MINKINPNTVFLTCVVFLIFTILSIQQFNEVDGHTPENTSFVLFESLSTDEANVGDEIVLIGKIINRFDHDTRMFPDVFIHHETGIPSNYFPEELSNSLYFNVNSTISNSIVVRSNEIIDFKITLTPLQSGIYHIHVITNPHNATDSGPSYFGLGDTIVIQNKTNTLIETRSPYLQMKSGISPENVICNDGRELAFKVSNNLAVCLFPDSVLKLTERNLVSKIQIHRGL